MKHLKKQESHAKEVTPHTFMGQGILRYCPEPVCVAGSRTRSPESALKTYPLVPGDRETNEPSGRGENRSGSRNRWRNKRHKGDSRTSDPSGSGFEGKYRNPFVFRFIQNAGCVWGYCRRIPQEFLELRF